MTRVRRFFFCPTMFSIFNVLMMYCENVLFYIIKLYHNIFSHMSILVLYCTSLYFIVNLSPRRTP